MNNLKNHSWLGLAICLLITLTGCSSEEEEVAYKVTKAEVRVNVTLSQHALDFLSLHVKGKVSDNGHIQQNELPVNQTSQTYTFTATSFPATFDVPISVTLKRRPETLVEQYSLNYKVEYMVVVTYDNGTNEAFDGGPMGFGVSTSITLEKPDEEGLAYCLNLIKKEIEEKCNFSKKLEVKNGKISL